jgi:hypothetical protein
MQESAIERDDIKDPFSEVSMFKKNYDHVTKETYFGLYREATRGNPNYFLTYGNGKAASRIQDNLRPNGAHRWHNYMKTPNEIKFEEAAVLHYTYTKFSDLTSRRDRCGCKPTKEDVKRCFMLEFDRAAFIIASTASQEEMRRWYMFHQLLSIYHFVRNQVSQRLSHFHTGNFIQCLYVKYRYKEHVVWTDKELNLKLMRKGLLTRIYAPQVIVQGLREAGVFSDALLAGQMHLEKSKSQEAALSFVSTPNSVAGVATGEPTTVSKLQGTSKEEMGGVGRGIGKFKEVVNEQGTDVRKLLEISTDTMVYAVAPLSPPDMEQLATNSFRT